MTSPLVTPILLLILAMPASAAAIAADEPTTAPDSGASIPVETFTPPAARDLGEPRYPLLNQRLGREGWVKLTFMVSPTGEPYDIAVVDAVGDERFETAAVEAAQNWVFEPATLGGQPIDAGMTYMVTFELTDNASASSSFVRAFRRIMTAIQEGERAAAERGLTDLGKDDLNLYEEANLNLAAYQYYAKWGTAAQQYGALSRATAMDKGRGFLPEDVLTSMLANRFALELQLNLYARAAETGRLLLERSPSPERKAAIEQALTQIDALAGTDQPILVAGRIDRSAHFFHLLLRPRFQFQDIDGDIAELRLHCDQDYAGFSYTPGMAYTVNGDLSDCTLRVIGTPGTTFTLVEL